MGIQWQRLKSQIHNPVLYGFSYYILSLQLQTKINNLVYCVHIYFIRFNHSIANIYHMAKSVLRNTASLRVDGSRHRGTKIRDSIFKSKGVLILGRPSYLSQTIDFFFKALISVTAAKYKRENWSLNTNIWLLSFS